MAKPEMLIQGGLSVISLANIFGCAGEMQQPAKYPTPVTSILKNEPVPTSSPTSSREKITITPELVQAVILADYDLAREEWLRLADHKRAAFSLGKKLSIANINSKYPLMVNPQGLEYWLKFCQINLPENQVGVQLTFYERLAGLNAFEFTATANGIFLSFGLEAFYQKSMTDLAFYQSHRQRINQLAVNNLVNLSLNARLIYGLCGGGEIIRAGRINWQKQQQILDQVTLTANSFQQAMLERKLPLAVVVSQTSY